MLSSSRFIAFYKENRLSKRPNLCSKIEEYNPLNSKNVKNILFVAFLSRNILLSMKFCEKTSFDLWTFEKICMKTCIESIQKRLQSVSEICRLRLRPQLPMSV